MSCPLGTEELNKLKIFISFCSLHPQILNNPELEFFKTFVEKLGGKVPPGDFKMPDTKEGKQPQGEEATNDASSQQDENMKTESEEEFESDIELDMTGVIEPDKDEPQSMGDSSKIPTEEEIDESSDYRAKAAAAYSEQKFEEAIDLYTKAIEINPGNALFHAKRGQTYLKLQKPNACIRDCDKALELNCDSAAAYKYRGRAHRLLGNFEKAAQDLRQACKIDFDEEADEWLREVTPNAKKIEQHRIKQERKKAERELRKRQETLKNRQKAQEQAKQQQQQQSAGAGGAGAGAGSGRGGGMPDLKDILMDEKVTDALKDPEIAAAMQDIMLNPANIAKYQNNPKFVDLLGRIQNIVGAGGGNLFSGGFPGAGAFPGAAGSFPGSGGFPGFGQSTGSANANATPKPNPKPDFSDDGLD